jgi:hypothetical protein
MYPDHEGDFMKLPASIADRLIRRKGRFDRIELGRFTVRPARTIEEYELAFRLVQLGYLFRGIEPLGALEMRITEQHVLPEATVMCAWEGDQIVGTMTVTVDSPAGLPLDKDYPQELAALRSQGRKLAEFGSFAIVQRCWGDGVAQLLSIACARMALRIHHATDIVIGIHPKAGAVYRALWGFTPMAAPQEHAQLRAPVQPWTLSRDRVTWHLTQHCTVPMRSGASVLEHILGPTPHPDVWVPDQVPVDDLAKWKMPREVFQGLFHEKTDHLRSLTPRTESYLRRRRSDETVGRIPTPAPMELARAS